MVYRDCQQHNNKLGKSNIIEIEFGGFTDQTQSKSYVFGMWTVTWYKNIIRRLVVVVWGFFISNRGQSEGTVTSKFSEAKSH